MEIKYYDLGSMTAVYTFKESVSFCVVPKELKSKLDIKKLTLEGVKHGCIEPLVQVAVFGDAPNRQYSAGQTMRNGESCFKLKYVSQTKTEKNGIVEIVTVFKRAGEGCLDIEAKNVQAEPAFCDRADKNESLGNRAGCSDRFKAEARHIIRYIEGTEFLECYTEYKNCSSEDITLEMLSSFSLSSLTPFKLNNPVKKIKLHRIRSQWSAEASLESMPAEQLLMEPSWMNYGVRGERFGQIGSMPCRPFMPFIALTDEENGVTWAVSIACASSWQAEFYLAQNSISLSGGLADFEFGHWRKTLKSGESLVSPKSYITSVRNGVDYASQALTSVQNFSSVPEQENSLPIIYNDWCKNWGKCSKENLIPLIDSAKNFGLDYFVIDAGWSMTPKSLEELFLPKKDFYPNGIEEIVGYIKAKGMRAGIWFEFESRDYEELNRIFKGHLLTRNGMPIRNLERAFVDMRDPFVFEVMTKKVIDFLKEKGFGYIKIDYNENIGVGVDGLNGDRAESLGEGLRQHILKVQDFFRKMREANPDLVMEICSSGGMRTEPSMIALGSQVSFSDIHETTEGSIVASDIHRVLQPRRSQIWATVRETDDENRLVNTISKGFLGRLCFSGDIEKMNAWQQEIIKKAVSLYRRSISVIKDGLTHYLGKPPLSYREPRGYKASLRVGADGKYSLFVLNTFSGRNGRLGFKSKLFDGFKIDGVLANSDVLVGLDNESISIEGMKKDSGLVVLLHKE